MIQKSEHFCNFTESPGSVYKLKLEQKCGPLLRLGIPYPFLFSLPPLFLFIFLWFYFGLIQSFHLACVSKKCGFGERGKS